MLLLNVSPEKDGVGRLGEAEPLHRQAVRILAGFGYRTGHGKAA
jgi:hypothetical protein